MGSMGNKQILNLYDELLKKWGDSVIYWPEWCAKNKTIEQREIIAVGAILVQKTSWHNAEIALRNLKKASLLSIKAIANIVPKGSDLFDNGIQKVRPYCDYVSLVRVAGFYTTKPKRLVGFCRFIVERYGGWTNFMQQDKAVTREELLTLYGIGPETADTILLYACDQPTFVIDEYTKRFVKKNNLSEKLDYDYLKQLFEINLPKDYHLFQNFHALIVINEKQGKNSTMGII